MTTSPTTVGTLLRHAAQQLADVSATPRLDAELLLAAVLDWPRSRLLAERDEPLNTAQIEQFSALLARRLTREPVAYLLGRRAFYGLDFYVDRRVLVPRPETELLVERVLAIAAEHPNQAVRIADIGTGSGAIAVTLAVHLPLARIIAGDISSDALAVAAVNAARHGVSDRISLREGDLLAVLDAPVDILVSNPPYTLLHEVDQGVFAHEPHLALDGGPDGLDYYRRLLAELPGKLAPGGSLLLEIGAWQGDTVRRLTEAACPQASVRVLRDLAGLDRVIEARHDPVI